MHKMKSYAKKGCKMETQQSVSFYQIVQQRVDGYLHHVNLSSYDVIRYVTVFGISFLLGVLLKRYGMIIISWLIGIVFLISVLHYFDLVVIQKANMKVFFHVEHVHSLDDLIVETKTQIQRYWIESIVATVAIILGFKLG